MENLNITINQLNRIGMYKDAIPQNCITLNIFICTENIQLERLYGGP